MTEELYFKLTGDKTSSVFREEIKNASPYIEKFCKKYDVALTKIDVTNENEHYEACFAFTDNLGWYTLEGLINSLDEK